MIYITEIHMASPADSTHERIAKVRWIDPADNNTGESATATIVDWIDNKSGEAKVKDPNGDVPVGTVDGSPKHLRTHADGKWTNNLLSLPRF